MSNLLDNKSVLVTGGTGSFGRAFIKTLLNEGSPRRVVVLSRDELKQSEFRHDLGDDERVRWFIGDVRDPGRLKHAFRGVDVVIHAAALKQVDTAEYNPFECISTNVLGAENVINAALEAGVSRVIALSTDKASSPINLYGASKLCSDKLFVAANNYAGDRPTRFAVVRYGNVVGSRGSVVPLFRKLAISGRLPVTDPRMTRFWITLDRAVQFVFESLERMRGGEIYVPRIPSTTILDLAKAIAPEAEIDVVGIRPGEKLHEEMISEDDARRSFRFADHFVITPLVATWTGSTELSAGERLPDGYSYKSDTNDRFLSVEEIKTMLGATI